MLVMKTVLISLFAVALLSCSNTQLLSSWKASDVMINKYNKVLVLALMGDKDRNLKETLETYVSDKLKNEGIDAATASQQYGPRAFKKMDQEEAVKTVNDNGFDGVMVIALVDKTKDRNYTPGTVTNTPYAIVRNRWYNRYVVLYDQVYNPGYYSTATNYILEANFYNTKEDKLAYSAQTKTVDPSSAANLADNFGKTILKDILNKKIVANK